MAVEVTGEMARGYSCRDEEAAAGSGAAAVAAVAVRPPRHFHRAEASAHAVNYSRGLVAGVERTNGRLLAERAGYAYRRAIQRVPGPLSPGRRCGAR